MMLFNLSLNSLPWSGHEFTKLLEYKECMYLFKDLLHNLERFTFQAHERVVSSASHSILVVEFTRTSYWLKWVLSTGA